jgi:hypothetical protein
MNTKNIVLCILFLLLLSGCAQNSALLGPAYTLGSGGTVSQAGLTYSSNAALNKVTGKTISENIKKILTKKDEDSEFKKLVKKQIEETRKKLNLIN